MMVTKNKTLFGNITDANVIINIREWLLSSVTTDIKSKIKDNKSIIIDEVINFKQGSLPN